jgi:hypothetical protein
MTSATKIDRPSGGGESGTQLTWFFRVEGAEEVAWDWQRHGAPPIGKLAMVRMPRSSASNRHIPVTAYSMINSGVVHLESGLEHDLVRRLDRDSTIAVMVSQPLRLSWTAPEPGRHTPDLLTLHADGAVTVWDVRAVEEQDDDFRTKSAVAREACSAVGWRYEAFTGLGKTERLNLLWLHGFRRRPDWADRFEDEIRREAICRDATIGSLFARDDGTGEVKSAVWHLLWAGVLNADLNARWTLNTAVAVSGEVNNV